MELKNLTHETLVFQLRILYCVMIFVWRKRETLQIVEFVDLIS